MATKARSSDISSIPGTNAFEENSMHKSLWLVVFILTASESFCQNRGFLNVSSGVQVQFIVTNPSGRRTGEDPRGMPNPMQGKALREIPGASYSISSVGDSPQKEYEPSRQDLQFEFQYRFITPDNDGTYTIQTIGIELGVYSLFVHISPRRGSNIKTFRKQIKGLTDIDQVTEYKFTYRSTYPTLASLEKVVALQTFRQELDNSYKLKLLGDRELHKDLSHRLDKLERYLADKDSSKAHHELEKFGEKIEDVRNQTIKTEQKKQKPPKHFITADAYKILQEDANALLKQLPDDKREKKEKEGKKEKDDAKDDD